MGHLLGQVGLDAARLRARRFEISGWVSVGGTPPVGEAVGTIKWKQIGNDGLEAVEFHLQQSQSGSAFMTYTNDTAIT